MNRLFNRLALCVALALPMVSYALVSLFGRPSYDTDYFEYIGWTISCGYELYRDIWDCKGPLLYYWYALGQGLFPSFYAAGTLLSLGLWEVVVLLVCRLVGSFCRPRPAGVPTLLFVVFALGSGTWLWIGCQEILVVFFTLVALLLMNERTGGLGAHEPGSPVSAWRCAGLGACVAAAFMVKATCAAFGGAFLFVWVWQVIVTGDWCRLVRRLVFSFVGFCIVLAGVSIMCSGFRWGRMIDASILYNVFDRGMPGETWGSFWYGKALEFLHGDVMWFLRFGWNYPFYLALFILSFSLKFDSRMTFFRAWLAMELIVAMSSKGFFDHYLIVSTIPLSALFATGRFRVPYMKSLFCAIVALFSLVSLGRSAFYYGRYLVGERWDWTSIAEAAGCVPGKTRVAVCGCTDIHVLLRRWKLLNRNAYSAWMFWFGSSSERRKQVILDDFEHAVSSPENEWILSECPIENVREMVDDRHKILRGELGKYSLVRTLHKPCVYFYRRTFADEAGNEVQIP